MGSSNKKKRKNNNKKNKIKRENEAAPNAHNPDDQEEAKEDHDLSADEDLEQKLPKRNRTEEDSDAEEEPKKKKKKKQPIPTDSSGKKGQKSIRQIKREKHALRQLEEAAVSKDQVKSQCISYLSQWKHDRQNWKFMKAKQVWLYKNKFSSYLLPESSWPVFLEYFESAKGNIRNLLLEDANKVIKQMDDWTESENNTEVSLKENEEEAEKEKVEGSTKPDDTAYKRARDLIQCLQE